MSSFLYRKHGGHTYIWEKLFNDICLHREPNRKIIPFSPLQVKSGTIFDNFLITDDPKLAEEVGKETWGKTKVRPLLGYSGFTKTCTCLFHS